MNRPRLAVFPAVLAVAILALGLGMSAVPPERPGTPSLPEDDRVRVAEAFGLGGRIGDALWPGWSRVPFALVLVTPETEFFIRHPSPPADARPIGRDALGTELRAVEQPDATVYARPRTFPPNLLATFPVEGVSTVVVGQQANTTSK